MHENEKAERTFCGNGVCHITSIIDWNSLVKPASGADPRTLGNQWTGRQIWAEVGSGSSAARFSGSHTMRADPVDLHGSEEKTDASETNGGDFMDHSGRFHSGEWMYLYHCTWWKYRHHHGYLYNAWGFVDLTGKLYTETGAELHGWHKGAVDIEQ